MVYYPPARDETLISLQRVIMSYFPAASLKQTLENRQAQQNFGVSEIFIRRASSLEFIINTLVDLINKSGELLILNTNLLDIKGKEFGMTHLDELIVPTIVEAFAGNKNIRKVSLKHFNPKSFRDFALIQLFLTAHPRVTQFSLEFDSLDPEFADPLTAMIENQSTLRELEIYHYHREPNNNISKIINSLVGNQHIVELVLSSNDFSFEGAQKLEELVSSNTTLQGLQLSSIPLDDEKTQLLAAGLKKNTTLKSLSVINSTIGTLGAQSIADALRVNSTLTTLKLDKTQLTDRGLDYIAESLSVNRGIQGLDLGNNPTETWSTAILAQSLRVNRTIINLFLGNCHLGDERALPLLDGLIDNVSLEFLDLNVNDLSDVFCRVLVERISSCSPIKHLMMCSNNLTNNGGVALARGISQGFLHGVYANQNPIENEGVETILDAVASRNDVEIVLLDLPSELPHVDRFVSKLVNVITHTTAMKTLFIGNEFPQAIEQQYQNQISTAIKSNHSIMLYRLPTKLASSKIQLKVAKRNQENAIMREATLYELLSDQFKEFLLSKNDSEEVSSSSEPSKPPECTVQ